MTDYPFHIDPRDPSDTASELEIQIAFRNRMHMEAPQVMLVAIPNEGKRSAWEGRKRQREGLRAGFPDMMALWHGRTAFLEFKTGTGSLSDKQIDCLNALVRKDFPVGVFRSAESAVQWLRNHRAPFHDA